VTAARYDLKDEGLIGELLSAYRSLDCYPEVPGALARLRERGVGRAILSNGEPKMMAEGVRAAGLDGLLDDVLSVHELRVFKPEPAVYQLGVERFGVAAGEIGFVSSNAWDAFGAREFGFRVFWVNRKGAAGRVRAHRQRDRA